ncbi:hypothetical protein GCM10009603_55010 [Nocardiopsis exhalans]
MKPKSYRTKCHSFAKNNDRLNGRNFRDGVAELRPLRPGVEVRARGRDALGRRGSPDIWLLEEPLIPDGRVPDDLKS